jgi:uncharacterized MAPEG superfamily protein
MDFTHSGELQMLADAVVLGLIQIVLAAAAGAGGERTMGWLMGPRDDPRPVTGVVGQRLGRALANFLETFPLFATPTAGGIKVSSNGFVTFDTTATAVGANTAYPNAAAPNALVSPYAEDLAGVTVCTRAVGDAFIVQWTGFIYNTPAEVAQFQVALHTSGNIDFIYGPNHTLNGSEVETGGVAGATVGVENATGTAAVQILFNQNGIAPGTSRTLTPAAP